MRDIFLEIVSRSMTAGWLVLVVAVLRVVLKRAPKGLNVLLWGMVALRLLCPVSIESRFSLIPQSWMPLGMLTEAEPDTGTALSPGNGAENAQQPWEGTDLAGKGELSADSKFPSDAFLLSGGKWNILDTLSAIWIVGALSMGLYALVSYLRLRKLVGTAVLLRDNIFQSERVASPFVLGLARPRIYLPFRIEGKNLVHVVTHEQVHIRRRDYWWKPLGFLLLAVYWFHPLMWLAYILLCRDIELACDERTIRGLDDRQRADYSQALLDCSVRRRSISACPLAFGEAGVKARVKSVLHYRKPAFWIVLLAAAACIAVAVCFLTDPARAEPDSAEAGSPEKTVVWEGTDLDRDGEMETICVRYIADGEYYVLEVLKQDGRVLWSEEAGTAHTGWNIILLCQSGGEDYLVRYHPNLSQGMGSYTCEQFTLEGGQETQENFWEADFEMQSFQMTGEMQAFEEVVNAFLKEGTVLLSTWDGELVVGPRAAAEVPWLYPIQFGEEEAQSDSGDDPWAAFGAGMPEDTLPLKFSLLGGFKTWDTTLTLHPDGSFQGVHFRDEDTVAEEYPRGTRYYCEFSGEFDEITKVNEYTYSLHLAGLHYRTDVEGEWIEDWTRYIGTEAVGLSKGETFLFYLPDTPMEELDETYVSKPPNYFSWTMGLIEKLGCYGIYNAQTEHSFFTSAPTVERE